MTNPLIRATDRALERHLTDKIKDIETSLTSQINAVEANLTNRIVGVERFFTAENKAAKEAVTIAMTASDKANLKTEDAATDRAKEVLKRLDQIDTTLATSGGWQHGVGSSVATLFQVISSLGVIIGLFVVVMQHR